MFIRKIYYLTQLIKSQRCSKKELGNLQDKKLRKLINYSYNNTCLYKKKIKQEGITSKDIKSVNDLQKIPLSTKSELKTFSKNDVPKWFDKNLLIKKTTSGSTGEPFTLLFDRQYWDYSQAFLARALFSGGVRLRDKIAFFWYEPSNEKGFYQAIGILRKKDILYTKHEENQLDMLKEFNPDIICGLPTVLSVIADLAEKRNTRIKPRIVFTFGELLTEPLRKKLESAFCAEVFNEYASTEFNWIGFECKEHCGFHINAENFIIESIKQEDGRNKILITDINNFVMPFIRYEIGDTGVLDNEQCRCGRSLPLLKSLEGRQDDFITLPSGRLISPRMIGGSFESIKGISKYKIIQKRKDYIQVFLEDNEHIDNNKKEELINTLNNALGNDIQIDIKVVERIKTNRGKVRVIESKVKI